MTTLIKMQQPLFDDDRRREKKKKRSYRACMCICVALQRPYETTPEHTYCTRLSMFFFVTFVENTPL